MNKAVNILLVLISVLAICSCDSGEVSQENTSARLEDIGEGRYVKKVAALQFTSTGCVGCPAMSEAIAQVQAEMPGVLVPIAFHMDYSMVEDPMAISTTSVFTRKYGIITLPHLILDFRKSAETILGDKFSVRYAVSDAYGEGNSDCGVAISTEYDSSSRSLKIVSRVATNVERKLRYHVFLVEDKVQEDYNNVLRKMLASDVFGKNVNGGREVPAGHCATMTDRIILEEGWNADNMRVVVIALQTTDSGVSWTASNVNECAVGGAVDFTSPQSSYQKHVAVWEFTGTWCAFCPTGYNNMNFVISRNEQYSSTVHVMAFHSSSAGDDPFALEVTEDIRQTLTPNLKTEYPAYLLNMNEYGDLNSSDAFRNALEDDAEDNPQHCAVAVSSTISEGNANVKVKLISEKDEVYRLAVFVVEDGLTYPQTSQTGQVENYVHNHVVRSVVSSSYRGDRLGEITCGREVQKEYTIELNENWVVSNTSVYALAIAENGVVNNMNFCRIDGGNSPFQLKN